MKLMFALAIALSLTGCGWFDRYVVANVTGYSETCVEGVIYLQFPSGVVPQYKPDGTLKGCN